MGEAMRQLRYLTPVLLNENAGEGRETATLASRAGQHVDPEHAFQQLRQSEPRAPSRREVLDLVFALRGGLGALVGW